MKRAAPSSDGNLLPIKQKLLELTGACCDAHLNADYKRLCKKAIEKMAKMRPAPFLRGRPEIWAAGIVHALGTVNFLFDKSFPPYLSATDLAAFFRVAPGSASQKATAVRDLLGLSHFNTEFMTKQMQEQMAPTFDMLQQMEQVFGGGLTLTNDVGDTIEDGQFIAADSPVQSRYYSLAERYAGSGPTPAIEKSLRQLIEKDPDFYDSYLMLRDLLTRTGREEEAAYLLDTAAERAMARITDDQGRWPPALEWGWLENRHLIRILLNKALAEWTLGNHEAALDLLRHLLRANPGDNIGARQYILAIRLGDTFEAFEKRFLSEYGYNALPMMEWFDANIDKFPDEFDWWKKAVDYDAE